MDWVNRVRGILSSYGRDREAPGARHITDVSKADRDFAAIARAVPQPVLASALAFAFRAESTRPFPELVAHVFGEAPEAEKIELGNLFLRGGSREIRPGDAVERRTVELLAAEAERSDPSVVDRAAGFLAARPHLAQQLGLQELALAISKISEVLDTPAKEASRLQQ
jgi:hypothetical protein